MLNLRFNNFIPDSPGFGFKDDRSSPFNNVMKGLLIGWNYIMKLVYLDNLAYLFFLNIIKPNLLTGLEWEYNIAHSEPPLDVNGVVVVVVQSSGISVNSCNSWNSLIWRIDCGGDIATELAMSIDFNSFISQYFSVYNLKIFYIEVFDLMIFEPELSFYIARRIIFDTSYSY